MAIQASYEALVFMLIPDTEFTVLICLLNSVRKPCLLSVEDVSAPPFGTCSLRKSRQEQKKDKELRHSPRESEENQQSRWFSSQGLRGIQFSSQESRAGASGRCNREQVPPERQM